MNLQDLKITEALAHSLFNKFDEAPGQIDWTAHEDARRHWRSEARDLLKSLEACGISFSVRGKKKLDSYLDSVRIIPATVAYDLNEVAEEFPEQMQQS